ncbi:unnamed protein product [Aphanomyces euteiches]
MGNKPSALIHSAQSKKRLKAAKEEKVRERREDSDDVDRSKSNKLLKAAEEGDVDKVHELLEDGADVNFKNEDEQTPLHEASANGYVDVVKVLIAHGATVDTTDRYRKTPLYRACSAGHFHVVQELLTHGADVNIADKYNQTPLYWAAERGHLHVVKELLAHFAMADIANKGGKTPLHWASKKGHDAVVKELLAHGASVDLADADDETSLHKASKHGHLQEGKTACDLANQEIRQLLDSYLGGNSDIGDTMSIASATEVIRRALEDIKGMKHVLFTTASAIFKESMKIRIHREKVLATGIIVEHILRELRRRGLPEELNLLLAVFEDIQNFWQTTRLTTQTRKLQLDSTYQETMVEMIGANVVSLQDRLLRVAEPLVIFAKVHVEGTKEDLRNEIGTMMAKMENLDSHLDKIFAQAHLQQEDELKSSGDEISDLFIQMHRGLEHYQHQVRFGNMQRSLSFEAQVETCQNKIAAAVATMSSTKLLPSSFHLDNETWMLSSEDVSFDPIPASSILGQGGYGIVYKGRYFGREVAVKQFNSIKGADPVDFQNLISKEIKAWKDVSNEPFILTLIGVCTKIPEPIVVSELCQTNIRRYIRDWPEYLLPMVYQFACGLASLHKVKIIYRDLKGDNVLVTFRATVAIADFGLSRTITSFEHTRTGVSWCGTLNWMSPEQYFKPRSVTMKSDVWSFGMTVWEILCNDVPYRDCSEMEFRESIFLNEDDRPEKPKSLAPELEPLWTLITKCWRLDPRERPSADEIVKYLETHYTSEVKDSLSLRTEMNLSM